MTEQQTGTSHADIGGVVVDLAKVPDSGIPAAEKGSHLRSTGRGYALEDGTRVAHAEVVVGPRPDQP